MTKLGLLFICVFFVVLQFTMGARVVRDVSDDAKKGIEDAFDSIKKGFEDTFTKENLDKFTAYIGEVGDKLKQAGSDVAAKVTSSDAPKS